MPISFWYCVTVRWWSAVITMAWLMRMVVSMPGALPCRPAVCLPWLCKSPRIGKSRSQIMNTTIQNVLDHYHRRIEQEREIAREARGEDWRQQALLAVGPEAGQFINILAGSLKAPTILEIGTSFGYSGIW